MPALTADLPLKIKAAIKDMVDNVLIIYAEKGFLPFKRPLMIAGPSLLAIYVVIYNPISGRLSQAASEVQSMTAIAQYAGDYENVKVRLSGYQRRMPRLKDKDEWLQYLITSTARDCGVSVDALGAQRRRPRSAIIWWCPARSPLPRPTPFSASGWRIWRIRLSSCGSPK